MSEKGSKVKLQHVHKLDAEQPMVELQVNMSNALTRSAHGLSLAEKRIVAACIAKTDQMPNMTHVRERGAWSVRTASSTSPSCRVTSGARSAVTPAARTGCATVPALAR